MTVGFRARVPHVTGQISGRNGIHGRPKEFAARLPDGAR